MFTSQRSLVRLLNGLIVLSLVLGGLAPAGAAQAATPVDKVKSLSGIANVEESLRPKQERSDEEEAVSLTLDIAQQAEPNLVSWGEIVTYTVTARHTGYGLLRGLVITDVLPDGLVFVPHSETGFDYDPQTKVLRWEIATLAPGAMLTGAFQARVTGVDIGSFLVNETVGAGGAITQTVVA